MVCVMGFFLFCALFSILSLEQIRTEERREREYCYVQKLTEDNFMEKKLFDVYYTKSDGLECKVRYCCLDKEEAKRLFFSESENGEELKKIIEVKKS